MPEHRSPPAGQVNRTMTFPEWDSHSRFCVISPS